MIVVAALLASFAGWLLIPPSNDVRLRTLFPGNGPARTAPQWLVPGACVVLGVGSGIAIGSMVVGVLAGIVAAVAFTPVVRRIEGRTDRLRAIAVRRQAPNAADLLAATLASGAPVERSVRVVSNAIDPPIGGVLDTVASALALGATSSEAWRIADPDGLLSDLSAGFIRSERSGAPLAAVLSGVAGDLRRRHRQSVEVAARVAGVRAIAPLAACFLPAFLLVGAVPIVASFASGLLTR